MTMITRETRSKVWPELLQAQLVRKVRKGRVRHVYPCREYLPDTSCNMYPACETRVYQKMKCAICMTMITHSVISRHAKLEVGSIGLFSRRKNGCHETQQHASSHCVFHQPITTIKTVPLRHTTFLHRTFTNTACGCGWRCCCNDRGPRCGVERHRLRHIARSAVPHQLQKQQGDTRTTKAV